MNTTKQNAGRLGGLETLRRHGRRHFSEIGKKGAAELYRRYSLVPAGTSGWALVEKSTGKVTSVWS